MNRTRLLAATAFVALLAAALPGTRVACAADAPPAMAQTPQEHTDAYVAMVKADMARDKANWRAAILQYREAMRLYSVVIEKYPQWNPDIIRYRLTYCANEINGVLQKSGKTEAELLSAAGPDDPDSPIRDRYDALRREYDKAQAELVQLRKEAADRKATDPGRDAIVKQMERDNNRLRIDLASAFARAEKESTAAAKAAADLQALQNAVDAVRKSATDAEAARTQADKQRAELDTQVFKLKSELADATGQTEAKVAAAAKDAEATRAALAEAQKDLRWRDATVVVLSNEIATLKRQNQAPGVEKVASLEKQVAKLNADLAKVRSDAATVKSAPPADLAKIRLENDRLAKELDKASTDLKLALKKADRNADYLSDATNRIAELEKNLKRTTDEATLLRTRADTSKSADTIAKLQRDNASLEGEISKSRNALAAAQQAKADAERKADEATATLRKATQAEGSVASLRGQLDDLTKQLAAARQARTDAERKAEAASDELRKATHAEGSAAALRQDISDLKAQLDATKQKLAAQSKQLDAAKGATEEADRKTAKAVESVNAMWKENVDLKKRVATAELGRNSAEQKSAALSDELAKVTKASGSPAALSREIETLKKQVADAQAAQSKAESALEAAAAEARKAGSGAANSEPERLKKTIKALGETIDLKDKEIDRLKKELGQHR